MQKVMVQIDWYTKIILTLIVVLLAGLLARPCIEPRMAKAGFDQDIAVYVSGSLDIGGGLSLDLPYDMAVTVRGVDSGLDFNSQTNPLYVQVE